MRPLPVTDPGIPELRLAARFRLRVASLRRWTVLSGIVFGVRWQGWQSDGTGAIG